MFNNNEKENTMEFKDRLKELRAQKGLSQVALAEQLKVSKSIIGAYETGDRKPSYEILEMLADFFNVSIDYLTGKESGSMYYLNPDAAAFAQEISESPGLRALFSAARDVKEEDLRFMVEMAERFKKESGE